MAGNYNKIVLVGNLTRDPETRYLANGSGVAKFSLAVNRKTKNDTETMYVDVVAWEKLGEICQQYLKKGTSVLIEGRLSIRSYNDKDGNKKNAVEIVASEMQMLGSKNDGASSGSYGGESRATAPAGGGFSDTVDDEIPF